MNPGAGEGVSGVDPGDRFGAHKRTGADTTGHDALRSQSLPNGVQCHPAVEDVVQNQNMATTNVGKLSLANV